VKVRDVLKCLHDKGWIVVRQSGSHRQLVNPTKPGLRVTVAGHPKFDVPKGTLNSIFKQAGWK
jgi:predicted RNA binding protein YcfA (HicA-like mRNA interferase family)